MAPDLRGPPAQIRNSQFCWSYSTYLISTRRACPQPTNTTSITKDATKLTLTVVADFRYDP